MRDTLPDFGSVKTGRNESLCVIAQVNVATVSAEQQKEKRLLQIQRMKEMNIRRKEEKVGHTG